METRGGASSREARSRRYHQAPRRQEVPRGTSPTGDTSRPGQRRAPVRRHPAGRGSGSTAAASSSERAAFGIAIRSEKREARHVGDPARFHVERREPRRISRRRSPESDLRGAPGREGVVAKHGTAPSAEPLQPAHTRQPASPLTHETRGSTWNFLPPSSAAPEASDSRDAPCSCRTRRAPVTVGTMGRLAARVPPPGARRFTAETAAAAVLRRSCSSRLPAATRHRKRLP